MISMSPPVAGNRSAGGGGCGQPERDQLAAVVAAADRDHDVLPAVEHVGHRRPALRRRHVDRADLLAGRLVERAQHRAALPDGVGPKLCSPAMSSVFVTSVPDCCPAGPHRWQVQALERRVIADVVRRGAERHLPAEVAVVHVDRGDAAVGRLDERQALHGERRRDGIAGLAPPPVRVARRHPSHRSFVRPDSTVPWWYGMSDTPGGGGTRPSVAIDVCDATYSVCVSGSYEPPGQFDAAACAPIVSVAIGPSAPAHRRRREDRSEPVARRRSSRPPRAAPA